MRSDDYFRWIGSLVHLHRPALLRVASREGLRPDEAFDCVQEALVGFVQRPDARTWTTRPDEASRMLGALVRNRARNMRRRHHRSRPHNSDEAGLGALLDVSPSVDELIEGMEEHARLHACVDRLAEAQRHVVTLRMLEDLPGHAVAEELCTTPGNVAVLLHRAKVSLRACMMAG